jgi:Cu/Ag efflux pump CusA
VGVATSRLQGKPYINIEVDRVAMARNGLRAETVLDVVEAGIGGKNVTTTIEGRERFPIQVRLQRDERGDIERLADILVFTPAGKWSSSTGSEVMRPLAAPVIGGMVSSFLHIMIVTPVLFTWLRERGLRAAPSLLHGGTSQAMEPPAPGALVAGTET